MSETDMEPRDTIPDPWEPRSPEHPPDEQDTTRTDVDAPGTASADSLAEQDAPETDRFGGRYPAEPPSRFGTDDSTDRTKPGWGTCPSEPRLAVGDDMTKTDTNIAPTGDTLRPETFSSHPPNEITRVGIGPGLTPLYADELLDATEEPEHEPRIHPKPPFLPTGPDTRTKR